MTSAVSGWQPWNDASLRFDPSASGFGLGALGAARGSAGAAGGLLHWWVDREALAQRTWMELANSGCVSAAPGGRE